MKAEDIDNGTLEEAEREARESRPSNSAMWDDRLYLTHFPVLSWAERGDDILSESNYLMALELLKGAEVHDERVRVPGNDERAGDIDDSDVIDATISDWLVGSLRQIFVRSRAVVDDTFTGAWKEAVSIASALQSYPVLDDSDFSEREWKAFETDADNALEHARHETDTDTEFAAYISIVWDVASNDGFEEHADDYASANWEAFGEQYNLAREGVLLARATLAYQTLNERDEIPGQRSLFEEVTS